MFTMVGLGEHKGMRAAPALTRNTASRQPVLRSGSGNTLPMKPTFKSSAFKGSSSNT